jgi:hypothetical protein
MATKIGRGRIAEIAEYDIAECTEKKEASRERALAAPAV